MGMLSFNLHLVNICQGYVWGEGEQFQRNQTVKNSVLGPQGASGPRDPERLGRTVLRGCS